MGAIKLLSHDALLKLPHHACCFTMLSQDASFEQLFSMLLKGSGCEIYLLFKVATAFR